MVRYELKSLVLDSGRCPFEEWMEGLRDLKGVAIVRTRLDRVTLGNLGNCRSLKGGMWELKIDFGPGYRVYYGMHRERIILLLGGGDKSSQDRDIREARSNWQSFLDKEVK